MNRHLHSAYEKGHLFIAVCGIRSIFVKSKFFCGLPVLPVNVFSARGEGKETLVARAVLRYHSPNRDTQKLLHSYLPLKNSAMSEVRDDPHTEV